MKSPLQSKKAKKIVLTGGPGVGKTSIICNLQGQNYEVRAEVFTDLFAKAQKEGKFNEAFLHSPELVRDLLQAQCALEGSPCKGELIFLDRSRIDIYGFVKNMGITPFEQDSDQLLKGDYDLFFVIQPMPKKYYDQNHIRRQDYEESLKHHEMVVGHYKDFVASQNKRDALIEVPFHESDRETSVQWRTSFILNEIKNRISALK